MADDLIFGLGFAFSRLAGEERLCIELNRMKCKLIDLRKAFRLRYSCRRGIARH